MVAPKRHPKNSNRLGLTQCRVRSSSSPYLYYHMQISEAFEVLSDKNKRAIYDQFGEEGLKGGGSVPGAGPGGFNFPGFPGGTFSFTSGPGSNFSSNGGGSGFAPTDPNKIFE